MLINSYDNMKAKFKSTKCHINGCIVFYQYEIKNAVWHAKITCFLWTGFNYHPYMMTRLNLVGILNINEYKE